MIHSKYKSEIVTISCVGNVDITLENNANGLSKAELLPLICI